VRQVVMFLYKLPEETLQNKRVAQALVEAWSRPIFELSTQYSDLKHLQRREAEADDPKVSPPHHRLVRQGVWERGGFRGGGAPPP
jgi:hypothetical protein